MIAVFGLSAGVIISIRKPSSDVKKASVGSSSMHGTTTSALSVAVS
jgi:hypothetical protein